MNKKSILLFFISSIFLFSACSKPAESKTPINEVTAEPTQEAAENPSAAAELFTEEDYIKLVKGEASNPAIQKEIPTAEFFIRPALADENSGACISIEDQGYVFAFTPNESIYPYDSSMFVSDMVFDIDTSLVDALKSVYPEFNESDFTYVGDNEVKHYMKVANDSTTNQKVTQVYFLYKSHLVGFTILGDASDNYLGYCNLKVIYF
ncbi:MAG: hypothetical protein AB1Z23_03555 [Eubacteriales bacterium]